MGLDTRARRDRAEEEERRQAEENQEREQDLQSDEQFTVPADPGLSSMENPALMDTPEILKGMESPLTEMPEKGYMLGLPTKESGFQSGGRERGEGEWGDVTTNQPCPNPCQGSSVGPVPTSPELGRSPTCTIDLTVTSPGEVDARKEEREEVPSEKSQASTRTSIQESASEPQETPQKKELPEEGTAGRNLHSRVPPLRRGLLWRRRQVRSWLLTRGNREEKRLWGKHLCVRG